MQITISPHIYGLLLILIPLPFEILTYLARKSDIKRRQVFWFTLCYISLNLAWQFSILDYQNEVIPEVIQYIVTIIAIVYVYNYWHIVSGIEKNQSQLHLLIINLIVIFSVLLIDSLETGKFYFGVLIHGQLIAFYFAGSLTVKIFKKNSLTSLASKVVIISCVLACATPIALSFLTDFLMKYLVVNLGFFILTIAYIRDYIIQMKIEFNERSEHISLQGKYEVQSKELEVLKREQTEKLEEYKKRLETIDQKQNLESNIEKVLAQFPELTERQHQVAKLIAAGVSYSLIGEKLFISNNTVRKHALDISLKMGLKGYKNLRHYLLKEASKVK